MKKIALAIALIASLVMPTQAQAAQTGFMGGPLTNLDPASASIHIALSNFPKDGGLYIQECVKPVAGSRPTLCNSAVQLWISTSAGATFLPTSDIVFKPTAAFNAGTTAVDCTVSSCGIFLRYDHTVPGNLTEDQFIAVTFKSSGAAPTKPVDEITATINGVPLSTRTAMKISYRQLATLAAQAKSGAALTYASLAPACALKKMAITALKGSGYCDIAITSPGTLEFGPVNAHFPLELTLGVQTIPTFQVSGSRHTTVPMRSNFGEKVTYLGTGSCTVTNRIITAKKGTCTIVAGAPGVNGLYQPLNLRVVTVIK
ncbi:MAG: hypothetical protein F2766_05605 [Actinobacteria bacterium]|uniref:Unannotated protein n=1 Tax=freshwater metagenome TaxID=449393 RepID=A0A6J6WR95_9ZZZZ|nr:hypothetical protein [Actinomycetota bacterium]MSY36224.1 hypothetical protein [Actinomycetota bacterium]MTB29790.1 hypothetical protein [Actinomycetota bacterium]